MTTSKLMPNIAPEPATAKRLHVAAAVIRDAGGKVLIAKRPDELHQGGLWEFPGGKVEEGEDVRHALVRELHEELAIEAKEFHPLIRIPYDYPDRKVLLDIWDVSSFSGSAHGAEGQEIRWVEKEALRNYQFPAANRPIITAATLPDHYLITPEPGVRSQWSLFLAKLEQSLNNGIRLVQFRAKTLTESDYRILAAEVIPLCHENNSQVLLNASPEIVEPLAADGVHISSKLLQQLSSRPLPTDMLVGASCHSLNELKKAAQIECDFAVLGPVQKTPSHPEQTGIGWDTFRHLTEASVFPVYALGGMTIQDTDTARQHGAQGIAAIRALWGEL